MLSLYSYPLTYGIPSDFVPLYGGGKPPKDPRNRMLALTILFLTLSFSKRKSNVH